ncbi:hypothetical protein C1N53_21440 [Pontibacter sp. SGAir0037]|nr:hypothetical protein C1N53_21440 [Pontibacter sp. SGAir0037]
MGGPLVICPVAGIIFFLRQNDVHLAIPSYVKSKNHILLQISAPFSIFCLDTVTLRAAGIGIWQ